MTLLKRKPKAAPEQRRRKSDEPHPVRNALTALGGLGVVVAFPIWLFTTFASAGDIVKLQSSIESYSRQTNTALEVNRLTAEVAVLQVRRGALSDRVYDLGAKQSAHRLQPAEMASLERYRSELAQTDADIAAKARLIDRLRAGR